MRTIHSQILPTKLEQIKPLASFKPDEQRQVWNKALETANGKAPSDPMVKGIIVQLRKVLRKTNLFSTTLAPLKNKILQAIKQECGVEDVE